MNLLKKFLFLSILLTPLLSFSQDNRYQILILDYNSPEEADTFIQMMGLKKTSATKLENKEFVAYRPLGNEEESEKMYLNLQPDLIFISGHHSSGFFGQNRNYRNEKKELYPEELQMKKKDVQTKPFFSKIKWVELKGCYTTSDGPINETIENYAQRVLGHVELPENERLMRAIGMFRPGGMGKIYGEVFDNSVLFGFAGGGPAPLAYQGSTEIIRRFYTAIGNQYGKGSPSLGVKTLLDDWSPDIQKKIAALYDRIGEEANNQLHKNPSINIWKAFALLPPKLQKRDENEKHVTVSEKLIPYLFHKLPMIRRAAILSIDAAFKSSKDDEIRALLLDRKKLNQALFVETVKNLKYSLAKTLFENNFRDQENYAVIDKTIAQGPPLGPNESVYTIPEKPMPVTLDACAKDLQKSFGERKKKLYECIDTQSTKLTQQQADALFTRETLKGLMVAVFRSRTGDVHATDYLIDIVEKSSDCERIWAAAHELSQLLKTSSSADRIQKTLADLLHKNQDHDLTCSYDLRPMDEYLQGLWDDGNLSISYVAANLYESGERLVSDEWFDNIVTIDVNVEIWFKIYRINPRKAVLLFIDKANLYFNKSSSSHDEIWANMTNRLETVIKSRDPDIKPICEKLIGLMEFDNYGKLCLALQGDERFYSNVHAMSYTMYPESSLDALYILADKNPVYLPEVKKLLTDFSQYAYSEEKRNKAKQLLAKF